MKETRTPIEYFGVGLHIVKLVRSLAEGGDWLLLPAGKTQPCWPLPLGFVDARMRVDMNWRPYIFYEFEVHETLGCRFNRRVLHEDDVPDDRRIEIEQLMNNPPNFDNIETENLLYVNKGGKLN